MLTRYQPGQTTHVVSVKRNTPQSLRALVNGDYIVDERFLTELEYATTEVDMNEPESLSPLESDFDAAWPDALKYLPLPGKEPNPRPAELFAPDSARKTVFDGYSFVFFNEKQFESLHPAITDGGGITTLFEVKPGITTGQDLARRLRDAASKDGAGTEGSRIAVIPIRFPGEAGFEDWAVDIQRNCMLISKISVVEQNELLDVILMKEAGSLQRPAFGGDSFVSSATPAGELSVELKIQ